MNNLYDIIIIGGGPAGLTAAIYLARAKYRTLVVEKEKFGGQITITHEVVNYPGVGKTSGDALTETMRKQAETFGAEFMLAEVESLEMSGELKSVKTTRGEMKSFGVLLATGAHPKMVGFKGESEFRGRGVAYCATCDGEFFTDKEVFVVGGGFAAAEEAVFLTKYARHVNILIRKDDFSCAVSVAEAARNHPKITVLTNTEVDEVIGDTVIRAIRYHNSRTGQISEYRADPGDHIGVFVFAGYAPATALVKEIAELNEQGYVITDRNMYTGVEGLYAAGDVCVKGLRQVVTAVGDGALAATELEKYVAEKQAKTGLRPAQPQTAYRHDASKPEKSDSALFDDTMLAQLNALFDRMTGKLILKLELDDRPVSVELKNYIDELAKLTDKLSIQIADSGEDAPCVRILRADGSETGLAFHGAPGGHEFTSFVLGLYNAAGPGQPLDAEIMKDIAALSRRDMKILVSLSCTMCPELVTAAQRIAAENENITAEVYDLNHFPKIRDKFSVMSVPCLIIDDEKVAFGKKNVRQVIELLQ